MNEEATGAEATDEEQDRRPIVTRLVGGAIHAYRPAAPGPLEPVAVFRPVAGDEVREHAVAPDLGRAYYTTPDGAVCVGADGTERWRATAEPERTEDLGHHPGCALSRDGRLLWWYRPDAMAGRGPHDHWEVLDAATGTRLARAALRTVGHGGEHFVHPDGTAVLLCVGEGQDGTGVFRGTLGDDGTLELVEYPWDDRCVIGFAPDGGHFLTVDHGQADATVHAWPGGEAVFTLTVDDFGYDGAEWEAVVEWSGGYLDADTLAVVLYGEDEETGREWFRSYRVDAHGGRILGEFASGGRDCYDLRPLGDGGWLTAGESGHPVRRVPEA
ncbi:MULTISPECIES: hypothetical protein [Kitasatospora]|uniref:Uncharacterized protein n=1 Tax=Kitasatospora setae (strain ATCC 33774 / DSM 43861 / JCM 3304 / KCC A-0304 / NBRC 14216 / KM-6054) TaxID=452652 RepID=E4NJG8_KITSK|nr:MULTISPECIES: hypothetical protein [Kitasatospora]BAJ33116.1 hypothetical protein KSE_73610 [Kitasatospora setae KM-6054]